VKILKNIIKEEISKNLKEDSDLQWIKDSDLQWIKDIEPETDLTPGQIKIRYKTFPLKFVGPSMVNFNDIEWVNGRLMLHLEGWLDFADLFVDNDSSQYGYVNKILARAILDPDDYFDHYHGDFPWDEVWDTVTDDEELLKYIKEYIKEKGFIGQELENDEDPDQGGLREDMLLDDDLLGELIEEELMFYDLKNELRWAYSSAYSIAEQDNIWKSVKGAITDLFGEGEWVEVEKKRNTQMLVFDVTDKLMESVEEELERCLEACERYFDPDNHVSDEHRSVEEAFEEYCGDCVEYPFNEWGSFIGFFQNYLEEEGDKLNPSFDQYPSRDEVMPYFREEVYGRV
jgi:RNAse (barnase) inhibitor barstar